MFVTSILADNCFNLIKLIILLKNLKVICRYVNDTVSLLSLTPMIQFLALDVSVIYR